MPFPGCGIAIMKPIMRALARHNPHGSVTLNTAPTALSRRWSALGKASYLAYPIRQPLPIPIRVLGAEYFRRALVPKFLFLGQAPCGRRRG
jgi:hypothetical protein